MTNKNDKQLNDWPSKVKQFDNELLECRLKELGIVYRLDAGGAPEPITYDRLCESFKSIGGIPDEFMPAEDPADRVRLWHKRENENMQNYKSRCRCGGSCSSCDPAYKD